MHKFSYLVVAALATTTTHFSLGATQKEVLLKIHAVNQTEIRLGKLAEEKGQSQQIRDYGKSLAEDHQTADGKVSDVAGTESIDLNATSDPVIAKQKDKENSLYDKLNKTKPADFDTTFAKEMEKAHGQTISELEKAKKDKAVTGTATATLIDELLPKLQEHKSMASKLQDKNNRT